MKQGSQTNELAKGVDVLVATPGRLLDLMGQGFILLKDMLVGEFCNAFSDLKIYAAKISGSKADTITTVVKYNTAG